MIHAFWNTFLNFLAAPVLLALLPSKQAELKPVPVRADRAAVRRRR